MTRHGNPNVFSPLRGRPRGSGRIIVLDIETWGLDARPDAFALGVVFDGHKTWSFLDRKEMVEFITSDRWDGATFYAHNGGRFDYLCLFGNYWKYFGARNLIIRGSKLYEAVVRHERIREGKSVGQIIRFRDSFNLIPTALAKIGKALGYPKGDLPEKFKSADRAKGITAEDIDYCARDCEVLWRALAAFRDEFGELRPTVPATAMAVFRRQYLPAAVWVRRDLDKEFRAAYFGGRVEAYRVGPLPPKNYYYDVNSLFPFAMACADFPDPSTLRPVSIETEDELKKLLETNEGFSRCAVTHPNILRGLLPYRRLDGRLLFPIGEFTGAWTFPELRAFLLRGGRIRRVLRCVVGARRPSPFVSYVKRFYEGKKTSEGFKKEIYKLMLNGLYGKFGEYHDEQEIYAVDFDPAVLDALIAEHGDARWTPISAARKDGYYIYKMGGAASAGHSIYSWAAYITATARVINIERQELFERLGYETYYTDTDSFTCSPSFVVSGDGGPPIPDSEELGELKLEYCHDEEGNKTHTTALRWVGGNKFYQTCCEQKLKGVKKEAEVLSSDPDGRPIVFRYKAIRGLKDAIRKGVEAGEPYFVAKHISRQYDKRIVDADGTTRPICLCDV